MRFAEAAASASTGSVLQTQTASPLALPRHAHVLRRPLSAPIPSPSHQPAEPNRLITALSLVRRRARGLDVANDIAGTMAIRVQVRVVDRDRPADASGMGENVRCHTLELLPAESARLLIVDGRQGRRREHVKVNVQPEMRYGLDDMGEASDRRAGYVIPQVSVGSKPYTLA